MSHHFMRRRLGATTLIGLAGIGIFAASEALASSRPGSQAATTVLATPPPTGTLSTLAYTAPAGSEGNLAQPLGVSALGGNVYVSNSGDNVLSVVAGGNTTTVAGSFEGFGETGDGGPAARATLFQPTGSAEDSAGNLYVADTEDDVVREINVSSGVIARIAGTGIAGHKRLGNLATQAELNAPQGVAVNASGDVFIADTNNNRVVEVLPSGRFVDFAGNGRAGYSGDGGEATAAELNHPVGVAVDAKGNVYIADSSNNVIRRVDAGSGVISTVAGDFAADQVATAVTDGDRTVFERGQGGFSGDGGPATSARLNDPEGIALDPAGDLFIADTFNDAIREVTPAGDIFTVVNSSHTAGGETAGPATASQLNGPSAVAVDASTGTLYIADTTNNDVAAVTGLAPTGPAAAGPVAPAPGS